MVGTLILNENRYPKQQKQEGNDISGFPFGTINGIFNYLKKRLLIMNTTQSAAKHSIILVDALYFFNAC